MMNVPKVRNAGIGVDVENIKRFKKLHLLKDKLFFEKVFTLKEVDYCFSKKDFASSLAVRFAAKESVIKALHSLGISNISYREIEVSNNKEGVPFLTIHNKNYKNLKLYVSLSHSQDMALAFVIIVKLKSGKIL